jgi:DNA-binding beta-propeller fold protein YncE
MRRFIGIIFVTLLLAGSTVFTGSPHLVSVEPLEMCASFPPGEPAVPLLAELRQDRPQIAGVGAQTARTLERAPLRTIRDSFPTYSAVAVDIANNEIVLQDENLFQIMVYDRMANTPPTASLTEPKRVISGHDTKIEFNCGLYIDPKTGDIYSVNNDTLDTLSIFSRNARGNARPDRTIHTPHGTYGIAVNEDSQEIFLTIQHDNEVVVHRKTAQGNDKPLRVLQGQHVGLADPHGIGLDTKNQWMFIANYGNAHQNKVAGSGTFVPPSINIYPLKASGDTPPLRVITGPKTQLNWPAHVYVDPEHGEVFVANDGESSILVFRVTDSGDVAPTRVLKGAKTQIKNPTGIFVDTAHNELVVANMGNHSATVYPRAADGDTAPLRTIRTAPPGKAALQIGNPGSVAYDTKRDAIISPN